ARRARHRPGRERMTWGPGRAPQAPIGWLGSVPGNPGPTARDNLGHALERNVGKAHAGVDREVVHALLGLLDQRVAVDPPGQLLGLAADLLERLIDRHRPDWHWRVPEDPLAGLVDILAGRTRVVEANGWGCRPRARSRASGRGGRSGTR